jgi:1-phosphofructokinase
VITTLTANPSVDQTFEISPLVPGQVHRTLRQHQEPSGKGVNVTRALSSNGVASLAVLPLGGHEGAQLAALLDAEGVQFVAVPIAGSVRVNISLAEPDGRVTKINSPGPTLDADELARLTDTALHAAAGGEWLVGSGSLPPGVHPSYYAEVCEKAHMAGIRFALDTSGRALSYGLAARPDIVKPNIEELGAASGEPIVTFGDALDAARYLCNSGARAVLVSLGPDGALLVTDTAATHVPAPRVTVRSTVGAGDALLAGFLAGGGVGESAVREAVAWAAAAVGVHGSYVPLVSDAIRVAASADTGIDLGTARSRDIQLREAVHNSTDGTD